MLRSCRGVDHQRKLGRPPNVRRDNDLTYLRIGGHLRTSFDNPAEVAARLQLALMASTLSSYLPPAEGLLPKWLLFLSIVSIGNSIQNYLTLANTREVYAGPSPNPTSISKSPSSNKSLPDGIPPQTIPSQHASPVTPLSARTFGTWTALASIVRLYGAYHIHEPAVYELCIWTFALAWAHFMSEWWVFGTARWTRGLAGPVIVANVSLVWMLLQWEEYVK